MKNRSALYGVLASVLVVAFVVTQFRYQPADSRSTGSVEDILALADREDLNVIFILIDTLRADHLSSYGYERETSPTIDELADTGVRFALNHSQSSWTKTSMATMWTGVYPHRAGILRFDHAIPESVLMPAEALQELGYTTAGVWRNGWVAPTFGFQQGFDSYHRPAVGLPIGFGSDDLRNPYEKIMGSDIDISDNAIEFLRANGHEKFFLYIHYMDAHQYVSDAESALFGTSYIDLYDNAIHWTDRHVKGLLAFLEQKGIRDRTLIVIASDHGEAFGEHGSEGHAKDLHWEVTHVPLIVSFPFKLEEGIVVETLTENIDVMPTLFDLLGQAEIPYADGRSRLPEILHAAGRPELSESDPAETPLYAELDRNWGKAELSPDPILALTTPGRRYMRAMTEEEGGREILEGMEAAPARLYDITKDRYEQYDLIENGDVADAPDLEAIVRELRERPAPPWRDEVGTVELTDLQKGQLKAIGYAID